METGLGTRPNLHGLLRYPAMMVPSMQGDIIDAILDETERHCDVIDPFVGSGTTLTESTLRGLDFTGVDINPLAAMVCEAKAAIDGGADVERAVQIALTSIRSDCLETIDAQFPNRSKWFSDESAIVLSKIRRAIMAVPGKGERKVLWTVFAETIRLSSNSRTSTYKLHIRRPDDRVSAEKVNVLFEQHLRKTLARIVEYREKVTTSRRTCRVEVICGDSRTVPLPSTGGHRLIVTSPPYGDNVTTIPYGQFSYLALKWIPETELPTGCALSMLDNTHALDSVSLGGSTAESEYKQHVMSMASPSFRRYVKAVHGTSAHAGVRKVTCFMFDFFEALSHVRDCAGSSAHWVLTTGNRTAAGARVPFDRICSDLIQFLGGRPVAVVRRELPNKRMPLKNSMGEMITSESTLVAEFS